jgi:hypothetical protein
MKYKEEMVGAGAIAIQYPEKRHIYFSTLRDSKF